MSAERAARRRGSRLVTMLALGTFGGLLIVGIMSDPNPYYWVMAVQASVPFLAFSIVWFFPRFVSFGADWADKYLVWAILVPLVTLISRVAFFYANLLHEAITLAIACAASGILCSAAVWLDPELSASSAKSRITIAVALMFFSPMYFYAVVAQLNVVLDKSSATVYKSKVVAKSYVSGLGFHPDYQLTMESWTSERGTKAGAVPLRLFSNIHRGDTVCVVQREGWLGMRWYTIQACPWAGGPVVLGDVGRAR